MDAYRPPDDLDFDNPYAPPKASFEPEEAQHHLDFGGIPFSIESIVNASWAIFKENLGACLWVFWGVALLNMGLGFFLSLLMVGLQAAMPGDQRTFMVLYYALNLVSTIIQVWLGIGMTRGLIKIVRGEPLSFDVLFSGGRYLLTTILAAIVVGLLFFGAALIPAIVMGVTFAALRNQTPAALVILVAFGALFVVLMIYLAARLMLFYYLVIDKNAGVFESIRLASEITRGRAGTIVLVYCMQIVLFIVGVLALCVGLVFALPLSSLLQVVTYLAAVGPVKSPEPMSELRWEEDL